MVVGVWFYLEVFELQSLRGDRSSLAELGGSQKTVASSSIRVSHRYASRMSGTLVRLT